MRIIGIDPGSIKTGYGIIESLNGEIRHVDNGVIAPDSGLPLPARLLEIFKGLVSIIEQYGPQAAAIENIFVAKNARSSLILGQARGAAILAATSAGLSLEEYTPTQVKSAVTGSGRAMKEQIQLMVKAILRLPEPAQEDASDALAVAICHCNSAKLAHIIKQNR